MGGTPSQRLLWMHCGLIFPMVRRIAALYFWPPVNYGWPGVYPNPIKHNSYSYLYHLYGTHFTALFRSFYDTEQTFILVNNTLKVPPVPIGQMASSLVLFSYLPVHAINGFQHKDNYIFHIKLSHTACHVLSWLCATLYTTNLLFHLNVYDGRYK